MMRPKLLLILGPSGVGKSTLIRELVHSDDRFSYIKPYVTRHLRKNELDKIYASPTDFHAMEKAGEFLWVNELYSVRYGTPREPIWDAFSTGIFPVLDWPVWRAEMVRDQLGGDTYCVYVSPPSLEELRERLESRGEDNRDRLRVAHDELEQVAASKFDSCIDLKIVNKRGDLHFTAAAIRSSYLAALHAGPGRTEK